MSRSFDARLDESALTAKVDEEPSQFEKDQEAQDQMIKDIKVSGMRGWAPDQGS